MYLSWGWQISGKSTKKTCQNLKNKGLLLQVPSVCPKPLPPDEHGYI